METEPKKLKTCGEIPIEERGKRYNNGKTQLELISPFAREQLGKVLTFGAMKYGDRNWEKGMPWMECVASLERHLNAFKSGEDFDPESGMYHMAQVMTNAMFLLHFYQTKPEFDNRPHTYLGTPKIGLDVDEVLADFIGTYTERFGVQPSQCWNFDPELPKRMEELKDDKDFWMNLKPIVDPNDIPFEPVCYVTSRPIPSEWTSEWLAKNGFSIRPVITVGPDQSKVEAVKASGVTWFVDDRWDNFVSLNSAGICCFLMDAPHNQRYKGAGYKRIKSLNDLLLFQNF